MAKERSILIADAGLKALERNSLTKAESLTLWHLVSTLPLGGEAISHIELGKQIAITSESLSVIMKRLCEMGFLVRGTKFGRNYHYKLNPVFFRII